MRYALIAAAALTAAPAVAQTQFPSPESCQAVRERVQLALARADQALQNDESGNVAEWSAVAGHYSTVYRAFCEGQEDVVSQSGQSQSESEQ